MLNRRKRIKSLWLARQLIAEGFPIVDMQKDSEVIEWYFEETPVFRRRVTALLDNASNRFTS